MSHRCFRDLHCYTSSNPHSTLWWMVAGLIVLGAVAVAVKLVRR